MSEAKKILYYALGASALAHIIVIGFMPLWLALALNVVLGVVLVIVLWKLSLIHI